MTTLDFAENVPVQTGGSVPNGEVRHIVSNRISMQSIKHRTVTVLMTITVPTLPLLAAKSEDDILQ